MFISPLKSLTVGTIMAISVVAFARGGNVSTNPVNPGTQPAVSDHSLTPPESLTNGRSTKTTFDDERDANMGENMGNPALRDSTIGRKTSSSVSSFGLSSEQIRQAQSSLSQNGHVIAVDGVMGPETARALRSFQSDKGLRQTGTLDRETMSALDINTDRAPASIEESNDVLNDVNRVK